MGESSVRSVGQNPNLHTVPAVLLCVLIVATIASKRLLAPSVLASVMEGSTELADYTFDLQGFLELKGA